MVDQDEISFIAQREEHDAQELHATGFIEDRAADAPGVETRTPREFVMFTPGHTVTGKVFVFGQTDLAGFVDATDPRFVPVKDVTARSLADRRVISHFPFVLINRTQMLAASEIGRQGDVSPDDVPDL